MLRSDCDLLERSGCDPSGMSVSRLSDGDGVVL